VKRARWLSAAIPLFLCGSLYSQDVFVSLCSGLYLPQDKIYREIYGQSLPLALEVRVGLGRHFGLAAGAEHISDQGSAFNVNQGEDEYPLRFRMTSFPASVYLVYPFSRISAFLGLGLSYHSYEEKWESADLTHTGKKTGIIVYSGAEIRLSSRISARLALRYESIDVETASSVLSGVNLGGISLLGGFSFRLS
jgi:opacity protein-like surface antigen